MSLVTRCPACTTSFKVVRDQLRVSDGWVRCGRCSQVFDATADLQEAPDLPAMTPQAFQPDHDEGVVQASTDVAAFEAASAGEHEQGAAHDDVRLQSSQASIAAWSADSQDVAGQAPDDSAFAAQADRIDDLHEEAPRQDDPDDEFYESDAASDTGSDTGSDTERPDFAAELPRESPPAPAQPFQLGEFEVDKFLASAATSVSAPRFLGPVFPPLQPLQPLSPPDDFAKRLVSFREDSDHPDADPALADEADEMHAGGVDSGHDTLDADDDEHADPQLSKAARRAQIKSARIAKARAARTEKPAPADSAPMVLAASESDAERSRAERIEPRDTRPLPPEFVASRPAPFGAAPVRRRRRRNLLRRLRISSRAALWSAVVFAGLLLLVQILRHERDIIVARQPSLQPLIAGVCGLTGCSISALKRIGDITIDGASFTRERVGDAYRLNFTLRNAASEPLAMPAVELSLLDLQEQTLIRRVIMPSEFTTASVLPGRSDRSASLSVSLRSQQAAALPPVSGYRVVAFYP